MSGRPAKPYPKHVQLASERKPYWRKVAGPKAWERIRDEKRGPCRVCGAIFALLDFHHLIPRDRGGADVAENVLPLCRDCHGGVENRNRAHVVKMLSRLTDAEYAYAIDKCGEGVFERVYGIEYGRA